MSVPSQTDLYFDLKREFPDLPHPTLIALVEFVSAKVNEAYEDGVEEGENS